MDCLCIAFDSQTAWLPEGWPLAMLPIGPMTAAEHLTEQLRGLTRRIVIVTGDPGALHPVTGDTCRVEWIAPADLHDLLEGHRGRDIVLLDLSRWAADGPAAYRRLLLRYRRSPHMMVLADGRLGGDEPPGPRDLLLAIRPDLAEDGSDRPAGAAPLAAAIPADEQPASWTASGLGCRGPNLATQAACTVIPTRAETISRVPGYLAACKAELTRMLESGRCPEGYLAMGGKVLVHHTAFLAPNCRVTGPAIVGPRCLVEHDSVLAGTIVLQSDVRVGHTSTLIDAVALAGTRLYSGSMHQREVLLPGRLERMAFAPMMPAQPAAASPRLAIYRPPGDSNCSYESEAQGASSSSGTGVAGDSGSRAADCSRLSTRRGTREDAVTERNGRRFAEAPAKRPATRPRLLPATRPDGRASHLREIVEFAGALLGLLILLVALPLVRLVAWWSERHTARPLAFRADTAGHHVAAS